MLHDKGIACLTLIACLLALAPTVAVASDAPSILVVSAQGPYRTLHEALARAENGSTIEVRGGVYHGPVVVNKKVDLVGRDWPVIDGDGRGTVVDVAAEGATMRGFVVSDSGDSLERENAGIVVEAPAVVIEGNRLENVLFGVYLKKAPGSIVRHNQVRGKDVAVPLRGDGIRVWYSNNVRIEANVVERARDVVLWYSTGLTLRGNVVTSGRYGLHFMYCDDALVEDNRLTGNSVGAFMMVSRRAHLRHNVFAHNRGPSGYGVGLQNMDNVTVEENQFIDNRVGIFVQNSPRELDSFVTFRRNELAYNDAGAEFLPSTRRNQLTENSFVDNQEQVSIAGGGNLEGNLWTVNGRGNYWSDYAGFDGNGDGVGDIPYRAERLFDDLTDRHPDLLLFAFSPSAQALDFAARAFPLVKPRPKLTDSGPLMSPVLVDGPPGGTGAGERLAGLAAMGWLFVAAGLVFLVGVAPRSRARTPGQLQMAGVPMVVVESLTKHFAASVAVDSLSFRVGAGEAVALWGANGAGKTTALRCLLGLLPFDGAVRVSAYDLRRQGRAARRLTGFVPQEAGFEEHLTVLETLRFFARLKKSTPARIDGLLQQVGLAEHRAKRVRHLSGGMKQRLALAVALLADPPLLVLDEPTANLDVSARESFLALLKEFKAAGKTLVFASHRPEEVLGLADRVLVLDRGRLVACVAPSELARHLGGRTSLHLCVGRDHMETAVTTLREHGFSVAQNGAGMQVQVLPEEKARPIALLVSAGIPVRDFSLQVLMEEGHA